MTPLQRHGALSADRLPIGGMNCIVFWRGILQMSYSLDSALEIALRLGEAGSRKGSDGKIKRVSPLPELRS